MRTRQFGLFLLLTVSLCGPLSAGDTDTKSTPSAADVEECVDVEIYGGINAVPSVTSQIYPSTNGNTVVNDRTCPLGAGPTVVVGYWVHPTDYVPIKGENPCSSEPIMKIAYPTDWPADQCYCWKHWVTANDLHPNSAKNFVCGDSNFSLTQWTDLVCGESGTSIPPQKKVMYTTKCCRDKPPELWSLVINNSGCAKEESGSKSQ